MLNLLELLAYHLNILSICSLVIEPFSILSHPYMLLVR